MSGRGEKLYVKNDRRYDEYFGNYCDEKRMVINQRFGRFFEFFGFFEMGRDSWY